MRNPYLSGLGFRLLTIVLIAALPILGLILYIDYDQRLKATDNAEENLSRYTKLIASDIGQVVEGAHQFLLAMGELDEVRRQDASACSAVFTRLLTQYPAYNNLTASKPNGDVYCSGITYEGPINISDRPHFQDAMRYKRFSIGSYIFSRTTNRPTLPFAYPLVDRANEVQSIIVALYDLENLANRGSSMNLPQGGVLLVTDRNGVLLGRYPYPERWVGETVQDSPLIQQIIRGADGITRVDGLDGIERLFAFTPVENSGRSLYVAVGFPVEIVYGDVQRTTSRNLIVLGVTGLLAISAAALFSQHSLLRPVRELVEAARQLEKGDLTGRVMRQGAGELAWLADSFNKMADSLEEQTNRLRRAEENYRTLVEQIPAITYRADMDGTRSSVYISPQVETLLGYTAEEITTSPRSWFDAIHPDDRARIMTTLADAEPGMPWKNEFRMVTRDGRTLWFRDEGVAVIDEKGESAMLHGVMFDITERQQILETLQHERDVIERVMETSPAGILVMDGHGKIIYANQQAEVTLGVDQHEIIQRAFDSPGMKILDPNGNPIPSEQLPFSLVIQAKQPVTGYEITFRNPHKGRVRISINAAPLIDGSGGVDGVVITLEDITEVHRQRQELESLVDVTAALRNAVNRNEMYSIVLSQIIDLLNVDGASLVTLNQPYGDLKFQLGLGDWTTHTGLQVPSGTGITSRVITTGQSYVNNELQKDCDQINVEGLITGDITAGACVPLQTQGQVIGAIWVGDRFALNDHDVSLLSAIADIAANAIHRAALYEQTQARLRRLSALHAVDLAITSSLDLQVTLSILLDQVIGQMNVHAASILLYNPDTQTLQYAAGRGFTSGKIQQTRLYLGEPYAGQVALTRRSIMMPDVQEATGDLFPIENEGFMAYFAEPLIAKGQIKGVLELFHRVPLYPDQEWIEFFHALATQAAIAIDNTELFNTLQRTNDELTLAYDATIEGWSRALELRDHETLGHSERVTNLTLQIARRMGVKDHELSHYRRGVLLHDIGKMAIPDEILMKPGPLSPEEWDIMRMHPRYAYELLHSVPYLRRAVDIPYCHHERWDGSGYPRGLQGESIPLSARIFMVVDVWDTLRSARPYRTAWSDDQTEVFIRTKSGIQFDPKVVETFFDIIRSRQN